MKTPQDARARGDQDRKAYREAARRLFPAVEVSEYAHVQPVADDTGAFVEVTVWVPRTAIPR